MFFQFKKKSIGGGEFFGWLAIWIIAIIIVAYPKLTSFLANYVGVGRGVDLVIYISIIVIFYLFFRLLMRIERMEKDITKITRAIAIKKEEDDNR